MNRAWWQGRSPQATDTHGWISPGLKIMSSCPNKYSMTFSLGARSRVRM